VVATALPTQHRVPSHAVAFWRLKRRLKPQYQGLSGAEIAERRKARAGWDTGGAWQPHASDGGRRRFLVGGRLL